MEMQTTFYRDAARFLRRVRPALERFEAMNSVVLGISARLERNPDQIVRPPCFLTVEREQELCFAAMMTPPHNLALAYLGKGPAQALSSASQQLLAQGWSLPGVIGPVDLAADFSSIWSTTAGVEARAGLRERLFQLRNVVPPPPVSGKLRQADESDLTFLPDWISAFFAEALTGIERSEAEAAARRRAAAQELYIWEDGGPVSMAAKARPTTHGITVNLVYTPIEFRRHGYASACVAQLSQRLLDAGWEYCTLFTDRANPTSNHIYASVGYLPVADFDEYSFHNPSESST